ncbi:hypothetical protein ACFWM0_16005 [Streptomyces sp. NPDC058405]|uniref:hypothetical protein n=1 Tax=unclassified Streptomyces TaxID=2593676 RepID=UPI00365BA08C
MTAEDNGQGLPINTPADETPLLPEAVRALPYSWDYGFVWPPETEENDENLAYARAVLEACLPPAPLSAPEPPADVKVKYLDEGDPEPEWPKIRQVLRSRMPYARCVTRERMAEAEAECARRGLDTTNFTEHWTIRITGWIAEETLRWCALMVDDVEAITPWAMELAEQYIQRGMAAEQAVSVLRLTSKVPRSREALARLAMDEGLPPEIRELVLEGLG